MVQEELHKILKDLLPKLNTITLDYMSKRGVKKSSDLSKSIEYKLSPQGSVIMESNYYWTYVSEGRRRGAKKVPIRALIEFIKEKRITPRGNQNVNSLAFAIQTAIYRNGINPKNYIDGVIDAVGDLTEVTIGDGIIEVIADDVVTILN